MTVRFAALVAMFGFILPTAIFAQPTSAPTTQETDSTTPKGTLTLLNRATSNGDTASVRKLMHASTTQESRIADALVMRTEAYTKFKQAAVKSFGQEAASKLTGSEEETAAAEKAIQNADVKIDNDKAVVQMEGQPVNLVKVDGMWKLSLSGLASGLPPADVDKMLEQMKTLATVMTQT